MRMKSKPREMRRRVKGVLETRPESEEEEEEVVAATVEG